MSAETMYAPETGPFSGKKMSARERTRRLEEMFKLPDGITLPSHDAVQTCGCGEERDYRSWNWTPKEKPVGDLAKRVKPVSVCGLEFADVVTEEYGGDGEPCVLALDGGKVLSSDPSCSYTSPGAPRLSKFVDAVEGVGDARDSIVCVDLSHNALAAGDLPGAVQLVEFARNCKVLKLCGSGLSTRPKDVEAVVSMLESLKGHNALKYVTLARTRLSRDGRVMRQLHEQLSSEAPTLIWMSSTQVVDASEMKVIAEEWNDKQTFTQSEEAHREFYDKHVLEREPCAFPVPW